MGVVGAHKHGRGPPKCGKVVGLGRRRGKCFFWEGWRISMMFGDLPYDVTVK